MTFPEIRTASLVTAVCAAVLACMADLLSKWMIVTNVMQPPRLIPVLPFLNLTLGYNTGISFGIFADSAPVWLLSSIKYAAVVLLIGWAAVTPSRLVATGLGLIAGGALGNALDRTYNGWVTDFLDLHAGGWHWPAFNFADTMITVGAAIFVLTTQREAK